MSPALAGRFLTTVPRGKYHLSFLIDLPVLAYSLISPLSALFTGLPSQNRVNDVTLHFKNLQRILISYRLKFKFLSVALVPKLVLPPSSASSLPTVGYLHAAQGGGAWYSSKFPRAFLPPCLHPCHLLCLESPARTHMAPACEILLTPSAARSLESFPSSTLQAECPLSCVSITPEHNVGRHLSASSSLLHRRQAPGECKLYC